MEHGHTPDGSTHLIIRKLTMKNTLIRADLHYAFFEYGGKEYAYCNYFDITALKDNENRTQMMYEELNREMQAISTESLAVIRSNLSDGFVEKISGRDLFECDKVGAPVQELIDRRLESMPNPADRKKIHRAFLA